MTAVTEKDVALVTDALKVLADGELHSRTELFGGDKGRASYSDTHRRERWVIDRLREAGVIEMQRPGGATTSRYRAVDPKAARALVNAPAELAELLGIAAGANDPRAARALLEQVRNRRGDHVTLEHAEAIRALMREHGYAAAQLQGLLGMSSSWIYNLRVLAEAPEPMQQAFARGEVAPHVVAAIMREAARDAPRALALFEQRRALKAASGMRAIDADPLDDAGIDDDDDDTSDAAVLPQVLRLVAANAANLVYLRDRFLEGEKRAMRVEVLVRRLASELGIKEADSDSSE